MSEPSIELILLISVPELRSLLPGLSDVGFGFLWSETIEDAWRQIAAHAPAIVVVPALTAHQHRFSNRLAGEFPTIEVVLVRSSKDVDGANGAPSGGRDDHDGDDVDYLDVTDDVATVSARLRRALRHRNRRVELERLRRKITRDRGYVSMLGTSAQMQTVFELIDRAASANASVLITGESGTGKELVARALHRRSRRREQPFVAINCSAVPDTLLESELFGHVKGAFTDARDSRVGLFAKAHGGTLFLDEIGDMPFVLQPKLLRALQERKVRPVGGDREVTIDVRVLAATNRDLESAVKERAFREDLFYRLNVIHIDVPPLRERAGDILLLAESFVRAAASEMGKEITGLSRPAATLLLRYDWPGNVRELQNYMERAAALCEDEIVRAHDLPEKLRRIVSAPPAPWQPASESELVPLDTVERRYIEHVLKVLKGNKKAAARVLGLDRKTLYRKIAHYRIDLGELIGESVS